MKDLSRPAHRGIAPVVVAAVVVLAALLLAVGGVTTLPPFSSRAGAYLADRNLGLAVLLLALLLMRWTRSLAAVLLMTVVVHLVDALADIYFQDVPAVAGSLVVATLSAGAALWLFKQPAKDRPA
jgi:hypothetical protein